MEKFGVDAIYTPEKPVFSAKGAVVTNIAHIPAALTAVMRANATLPDFAPEGTMELKAWFGANLGVELPAALDLPVVAASEPYRAQIAQLAKQAGAVFPREALKDASGASQMDPKSQVSSLHGLSVLEAARLPLEANVSLALLHEAGGENDRKLVNIALGACVNLYGDPALAAAQAAREAGNAPNSVLAAAIAIVGPRRAERARKIAGEFIERFHEAGLRDALADDFDFAALGDAAELRRLIAADAPDARAEAMLAALDARGARSVFVRWLHGVAGPVNADAVLAALTTTLAWGPLMRKRVSRLTVENLPWWMRLFGTVIGASAEAARHGPEAFCGIPTAQLLGQASITDVACRALLDRAPEDADRFAFQTLVGILLTNGPGTISAQGAKGAVSADGPESPQRVQLNKALVGFLTHTGYAHGGNGFEGVQFLIGQFRDTPLADPADPAHGIDLAALARRCADDYARYKAEAKSAGSLDLRKIPGVNHPVFKDRPVNVDPREVFIRELMAARGEGNVFHDFYRELVRALHAAGVSRTVYCVNIDAVIAALLLKLTWKPWRAGEIGEAALESAAFTVFLYARMLGCAAEVDDHLNRGRNMDTRTAASKCRFVS